MVKNQNTLEAHHAEMIAWQVAGWTPTQMIKALAWIVKRKNPVSYGAITHWRERHADEWQPLKAEADRLLGREAITSQAERMLRYQRIDDDLADIEARAMGGEKIPEDLARIVALVATARGRVLRNVADEQGAIPLRFRPGPEVGRRPLEELPGGAEALPTGEYVTERIIERSYIRTYEGWDEEAMQ